MKRFIILLMCISCIGCSGISSVFYGDDYTPNELQDLVYQDGYIIGNYLQKNNPTIVSPYIELISKTSPALMPFEQFVEEVQSLDSDQMILFYAIRRAIERLDLDNDELSLAERFWTGVLNGSKAAIK